MAGLKFLRFKWVAMAAVAAGLLFATHATHAFAEEDVTSAFRAHTQGSRERIDHAAFDALLAAYVAAGNGGLARVDYARLKRDGRSALKSYLDTLAKIDPAKLGRNEQFAFWANLYNALTLETVLAHYPVKSIRDIDISPGLSDGPWGKKQISVKGVALSLDDIEHNILRPLWNFDPRIHYAVNCASISCPDLRKRAFRGVGLEGALDDAARTYINSPRGVSVNGSGAITASSLYIWYAKDFGANRTELMAHIRSHAAPALRAQLEGASYVTRFVYDWALNDIEAKAGE